MNLVNYDPVNAILLSTSYYYDVDKGKVTFGTRELWGVACTGPWLHDGRATTLQEAIELHGGEAQLSSNNFKSLSKSEQKDLITFLGNLVLYVNTAKNGEPPSPLSDQCEVRG